MAGLVFYLLYKLLERDKDRARFIAERLTKTIVLPGDATNEELLSEESIESTDVFCAVTNAEEANILSSLLAKRMGAKKVIALVNRPSYTDIIERQNIDIAVSPQQITLGALLTKVRRGDVVRVHSLRQGSAEALETIAHGTPETSQVVGRTVEDISLPQAVAVVSRNPARAVGLDDRGEIAVGKRADLVLIDGPSLNHLAYHFGINPVKAVVKGGRLVRGA